MKRIFSLLKPGFITALALSLCITGCGRTESNKESDTSVATEDVNVKDFDDSADIEKSITPIKGTKEILLNGDNIKNNISDGESVNHYFYSSYASLDSTVSMSQYFFMSSKSNDNADRRIMRGEYESIPINVSSGTVQDFVNYIDGIKVKYNYSDYYQIDEALAEQKKYTAEIEKQSGKFTDLICDIKEIPSEEKLHEVISKNSDEYLRTHKGYFELDSKEFDKIVETIHYIVELNHDKLSDEDLRKIYSTLKEISIVGIDSTDFTVNDLRKQYNARVLEDGTVIIDLNMMESMLKGDNVKERTYEHEVYHMFQRMCPDAAIEDYTQIGPSQYFENLTVNSLHWNWLYESSAEKLSMDHYDEANALVYKNMVGYLKSLDFITMLKPEYDDAAVETATLSNDIDSFFRLFDADTDAKKREIINMLYSVDYMQNKRDDFEDVYYEEGYYPSAEETGAISRDMKRSVIMTYTKLFYRNLANLLVSEDVSLQDVFYLIHIFEEDCNYHLEIEKNMDETLPLLKDYVAIQDKFFKMLASGTNLSASEIADSFSKYAMTIFTDDGLKRNAELNFLSDDEKYFLYDRILTYEIGDMTNEFRLMDGIK